MNKVYTVDGIFDVKMKIVFPSVAEENRRCEWKCHASIIPIIV